MVDKVRCVVCFNTISQRLRFLKAIFGEDWEADVPISTIYETLRTLNPEDELLIRLYYGKGLTLKAISEQWPRQNDPENHVSSSYIWYIKARALRRFRHPSRYKKLKKQGTYYFKTS